MDKQGEEYQHADIPASMSGLRACLRCALIKTFEQFHHDGCENCDFLSMEGNTERINQCTTSYFEGMIAMVEPSRSWVAKWQRMVTFVPGVYAIEVIGELPDDAIDTCESYGFEHRAAAKSAK